MLLGWMDGWMADDDDDDDDDDGIAAQCTGVVQALDYGRLHACSVCESLVYVRICLICGGGAPVLLLLLLLHMSVCAPQKFPCDILVQDTTLKKSYT